MTQWGLDTLFNPAKRHMDEEKRRLQSTREEIGDSSGGKRIDLESGKVTIRRSTAAQDEDVVEDGENDESAASGRQKTAEHKTAEHKTAEHATTERKKPEHKKAGKRKAEPSPAQIRAAQRRGRQPR